MSFAFEWKKKKMWNAAVYSLNCAHSDKAKPQKGTWGKNKEKAQAR